MTRLFTVLGMLLCAVSLSQAAVIFSESFEAALAPAWTTVDTSVGATVDGSLDQANGRYEYTGQTGPAGERARVTVEVPTTLSLSSDWTIAVDMHMDALSSFGTEAAFSGGLLLNTLQLKATESNNDQHQIEFNLAMLDSVAFGGSGVTSGYRFAEQDKPSGGGGTDVFSAIELTQTNTEQNIVAYLIYDATAQQMIAGIDTGSGLLRFTDQAVDTSGWTIASGAFEVFLESQIGYLADQASGPQNMAVTSGEMYYDNLTVWDEALTVVPEPSAFALISGICAFGFVAFRRRL